MIHVRRIIERDLEERSKEPISGPLKLCTIRPLLESLRLLSEQETMRIILEGYQASHYTVSSELAGISGSMLIVYPRKSTEMVSVGGVTNRGGHGVEEAGPDREAGSRAMQFQGEKIPVQWIGKSMTNHTKKEAEAKEGLDEGERRTASDPATDSRPSSTPTG
ncbi:hypothetical protein DL93DRAFT_2100425 [Clavulina sp. PMI_390]|nr:hypothetical protein DL93DRAFT_2100425 [Clavulina sp. PMI_390]